MPKTKNPINAKRDEIRAWFDSCDPLQPHVKEALQRAAKMIWDYQTSQEQTSESTIVNNNVGYTGVDAKFAANIVKWKGLITDRMAKAAKKMLRKYSKQLAKIKLQQTT